MSDNLKIQNSGLSGGVPPKQPRELSIKAPIHNFAQDAMSNSMGIGRMNPMLELFEMTINGLLVPGLHLGYAAMKAPVRKVKLTDFKQSEKVVYSTEANKCPWPVITIVDGEILYLFGQIPNSTQIEARFISWKKIKELGEAYAKTRAMIQERKAAIEAQRAKAAEEAQQAPAAETTTTTTTENEGQQPLDQAV